MKKLFLGLLLGALALPTTSCKDFLDVNTNPNAPQSVTANLYLPAMIHWMATAPQYDGRFVSRYTQQLTLPSGSSTPSTWDRMGYDPLSDNGGEQWRDVYWSLGQNLVDMMNKAQAEQRWDVLGVGYVLKAWGWQALTDLHGEIIVKEAIDPSRTTFDYDTQEYAYAEVHRLLDSAFVYLTKTGGVDPDNSYLAVGDKMYAGDRTKWLKFAHGLLALSLNHFSNKASYNPQDVIAEVDKSFASNADDALMTYPATSPDNADFNFLGRTRANFPNYRQTPFVVNLMNGTDFGGTVDPRLSRMLSPSPDGVYRGFDPSSGVTALTTDQRPNNPYGYVGSGGIGLPGRYLFADKVKMPVMTYAQLQFVKAEAAFKAGDKTTALAAYQNGISAHIDFVNARNQEDGQSPTQITSAEKNAFLADPNIVPASPANLTITQIMSQKYIAQWAWGHNELWMDMRRYHYTDIDPATGAQVYPGFTPPNSTILFADNGGKLVQRIRPRYNSEYVWNQKGLSAIGGLDADYQTKPMWITQP